MSTAVDPRVITVKRHVCPFCSRGHSKDGAARAHIMTDPIMRDARAVVEKVNARRRITADDIDTLVRAFEAAVRRIRALVVDIDALDPYTEGVRDAWEIVQALSRDDA